MRKKKNLNIVVNRNVFNPTGTSDLLIDVAQKIVKSKKQILDLGCGSGVIGISLAKKLNLKSKIYFSDISKHACKNTSQNCRRLNIKNEIKQGSIFDPWANYKFDLIISDVAAIAKKISNISPWYKNCMNDSGEDGTRHAIKIIKSVKNYLKKNGVFLFPIISLSNEKKIINELRKKFKHHNKVKSQIWPIPKEMSKNLKLFQNLKKKGIINFENKLGILTFKTDIYIAKN